MKFHVCSSCSGKCADWGLLVLRLGVGVVFFAHGAQKLFGWFGGGGLTGTAGFFGTLGLAPAAFWTWLVALVETFGGLALILGLFTSVAGALLFINMAVAFFLVHLKNGFFAGKGGYEFVLTLGVAALALALSGAGRFALDAKMCKSCKGKGNVDTRTSV
ncbi:DoxX family protein [Candidatus Uhrbacteria bacterium]|nr:DoxX family protein [Candidatus Uhrbacteria bacterium]